MTANDIFNDFLKIFQAQESAKALEKQAKPADEEELSLQFERFSNYVQADKKLRQTFIGLQEKFATDYDFRNQADPMFVHGVMMLDISEVD